MYQLRLSKLASRDLDELSNQDFRLIDRRILSLQSNPRPRGCLKLKGHTEDFYRLRQGQYRIIYSIDDSLSTVTILEVTHRKEVYR